MKNILKSNNKILKNMSWMLAARIINIGSGVLVGIITTRYLGTEKKGILSEVTAITTFFGFFASFGLNDILIKEFSGDKEHSKEIASSAICMLFGGGILSFVSALGLAATLKVEPYTLKLVGIYAVMYLFQFLKVFEYWFYSQAESRAFTIGQFIVHIICLLLRLAGVIAKKDLWWFILCSLTESILISITLLICYWTVRTKMQGRWKISKEIVRNLFKPCLPIIITGAASSVYMKVDQIMVGQMMSKSDLGIYSVAVNLAEYWYFIPGVIYMSFLPVLTNAYKDDCNFFVSLQKFADIMVGVGYMAVIGILVLGNIAIPILYGAEFRQAYYVLIIYIWSGIFTCLSYVGQAYFIIHNNTKILMFVQVSGAFLNLGLNLIFIPVMGIYGAAVATFLEYAIITFGQVLLLYKKYKNLYRIELKALIPFTRLLRLLTKNEPKICS